MPWWRNKEGRCLVAPFLVRQTGDRRFLKVGMELARERNKERCRKDRERPSLDGKKKRPPDS